jgi:hypothetical protein
MKISKQLKSKDAPIYEAMPEAMRAAFHDLSVNEAIEKGLITELGDDDGNFFFKHEDDNDAYYGIINGYGVRLSESLVDDIDSIAGKEGRLRFTLGVSNKEGAGFGKSYFRLGNARGLRLGDAVHKLDAETVGA